MNNESTQQEDVTRALGAKEAQKSLVSCSNYVIEPDDNTKSWLDDVQGLRSLYASNYLSDVLFVFRSESRTNTNPTIDHGDTTTEPDQHLLPAHRLVLALRSGAFNGALFRSKSSLIPGQIRFPIKIFVEDTSYKVFSTMIKFLYTNEVSVDLINDARNKRDTHEQFWRELLCTAYVYVVPALAEICVQQLKLIVNSQPCGNEALAEVVSDSRYLRKMLDIVVFCDDVLARNPSPGANKRSGARTHASSNSLKGLECVMRDEDVYIEKCQSTMRCLSTIHDLIELCMGKLECVTNDQFEVLIRSDTGNRCSTDRLCDILKRRSKAPLVLAITNQLSRAVNELLRLGEPLDKTENESADLPLVAALKTGNDAITRRLLVDADAPCFLLTDKIPLFLLACASGSILHCRLLIENNASYANLVSPLVEGDKEILIEYGKLQTPLHLACCKGHTDIVKLLLDHQAAPNIQDEDGNTPLHCAANAETVAILLSNTYRTNPNIPNRRGWTPLHVAAASGNVGVVDLLIHNGAEHKILDDQGQSAFHVAAANGHTAVALVLLHENEERVQNIQSRKSESISGATQTSQVNQESNAGTIETPSDTDNGPCNEIHDEVIAFDINEADYKGNTALHLAAMSPSARCQKMLQLLLENGADPNRTNWFGYTALHLFCSHQPGPASVVEMFVEHGTNIHTQSLDDNTALHLAVGRASEEVAIALVIAGAPVHVLDAAGRSVVDLAESVNQGVMLVPVLRNLSKAPEWVPDDQVKECSSCHEIFRVAMRKHHCRHCGRIVCYNCSSNKIAISKFQIMNPSRVCDTCYDVLSFRRLL